MALSNERMKCVIMTSNRDFRQAAINMFNGIGFPSEKLPASSFDEIRIMLQRDRLICNVLIDANLMSAPEFGHFVTKWAEIMEGKEARCLIIYDEQFKATIEKHAEVTAKWAAHSLLFQGPATKVHYVSTFFNLRKQSPFPGVSQSTPAAAAPTPSAPSKPAAPPPPKQDPKLAPFFEASGHVRETIEALNAIMKNPADRAALQTVGQRFNGIIGAFKFWGEKPGFKELVTLSDDIDTIARNYPIKATENIKQTHLDFVLIAAKCCYIILKELRETQNISASSKEEYTKAHAAFTGFTDLKLKEQQSQADIDSILDSAS
jgi:hypothetical protein